MNQKDIAAIRKHFKLNAEAVKIADIYNIYIRQDSNEIFYEELRSFPFVEQEHQELFLANFKKVLGGKIDEKLFEVKFQHPEAGQTDHTQTLLYEALRTDDIEEWAGMMQRVALKMVQEAPFEKDMVVTFIRFKYNKPTRRHSEETEIDMRDEVWTSRFILCSINQTELPKQSLVFDYIEREFKSNIFINPVIKLDAPIGGFMFPCFTSSPMTVLTTSSNIAFSSTAVTISVPFKTFSMKPKSGWCAFWAAYKMWLTSAALSVKHGNINPPIGASSLMTGLMKMFDLNSRSI